LSEQTVDSVRTAMDEAMESLRATNPDIATQLLEGLFRPDVLPAVLPAVGAAMQDEEGRMWVSRFVLSGDLWREEDAWHVLDPRGTPMARVRLPTNARLAYVRRDRVA